MGNSIGLLELRSIPPGLEAADQMLKTADVDLLMATPICPGKFVVIITGTVSAVGNAISAGAKVADTFLLSQQIIDNVHPAIAPALLGTSDVSDIKALGILETMTAITSIQAGDIAAKAANVQLMEIRIARGLGGKGFLVFTGELPAVQAAVRTCLADLQETGDITSSSVIASPHTKLIDTWM